MTETTAVHYWCGDCDGKFDTREARETHQDETGHGVRRRNQGSPVSTLPPVGQVEQSAPLPRGMGNNTVGTSQSGPTNITAPSEAQTKFIKTLLAERVGVEAAEAIRAHLNAQAKAGRLSKSVASKAIEDLLAITASTPEPASDKQINYLLRLCAERPMWADVENMHEDIVRSLSKKDAAAKITEALAVPVEQAVKTTVRNAQGQDVELEDGIYRDGEGHIFKVYHTVHGQNVQVAKQLMILDEPYTKVVRGKDVTVKAEFEYIGKRGLRGLTPEMMLTFEQAVEFGAVYGVCCNCSATLTDEKSIKDGIGPVCAKKFRGA